jgi:hypothetical protein
MELNAPLLEDPDPIVRRAAANPSAWTPATLRNLPMIQARLEKETDAETKQDLEQIVKWIHERAAKEQKDSNAR